MRQVLFTLPIFGVRVFGFGAMIVVAFISATWLAAWRAKREKLDPDVILDMAFWVVFAGMVGARLTYCYRVLGSGHQVSLGCRPVLEGGHCLLRRGCRRHGGVFSLSLVQTVSDSSVHGRDRAVARNRDFIRKARLFLERLLLRRRVPASVGRSVPEKLATVGHQVAAELIPRTAAWSLPVHPTQIYAAIDGLVLLILLSAFYPLRRRDGEVAGLLMLAYPITRFVVELLRNDEGVFFAGMTISQNISVALFAAGLVYWAWLLRLPKRLYREEQTARVARNESALVAARS